MRRKRILTRETLGRIYSVMDACEVSWPQAIMLLRGSDEGVHYVRADGSEPLSTAAQSRRAEASRREHQLQHWNQTVPVGTPILFRRIAGGPEERSRTRSAAWALGDGTPVVLLERHGSYDLDFVSVGHGPDGLTAFQPGEIHVHST